ncbi:hypothetical protein A2375_02050 [Candidatus Woesebacteria bacterium RIFOXYB1_FULL_31_120]|nr:MAG: hypothetical protein A2375_02050 [Candidatus Woesebacteria bacterium RIFOXYB1_FULL_31_120]
MDIVYRKGVINLKYIFALFTAFIAVFVFVAAPVNAKPSTCATIADGTITDINGNLITAGYDQYGYNYQAHMFNGFYNNYSRPAVPVTEGDRLIMKWSDAWISNLDCNLDGKLDRGLVDGEYTDGISKGWLTNHYYGDGVVDFVKIVWTGPGSPLWGQYTIVEEVWNDKGLDLNGLFSKEDVHGFGQNEQWTALP